MTPLPTALRRSRHLEPFVTPFRDAVTFLRRSARPPLTSTIRLRAVPLTFLSSLVALLATEAMALVSLDREEEDDDAYLKTLPSELCLLRVLPMTLPYLRRRLPHLLALTFFLPPQPVNPLHYLRSSPLQIPDRSAPRTVPRRHLSKLLEKLLVLSLTLSSALQKVLCTSLKDTRASRLPTRVRTLFSPLEFLTTPLRQPSILLLSPV